LNNIVSLSGGKDSIATALIMRRLGIHIHSMAHFITGWDFPQITEMVDRLEEYLKVPVVRLEPKYSFEHWMFSRKIIARKGPLKGKVHRIGNGWPSIGRRWCTRIKVDAIDKYADWIEFETGEPSIQCIGFAYDEQHRLLKKNIQKKVAEERAMFPLIENKITEKEALQICYRHGFDFGGLYRYFNRVSCFCCPLQSKQELRVIRKYFPYYWNEMLRLDAICPEHNRGFKDYDSVHDLEGQFASEDRMYRTHDEDYYEVMAPCF